MYKLGISTARGIYEYFLIDVEVTGSIQTSKIREVISAVQLYIYRCLNHLESGVAVDPELAVLWRWMFSHQEWQANREVFLYPEDYMQPELRKTKTHLFAKVEDDLKQADLTNPDKVDGIFKEYMNGFAEIANLKIVGSAARDLKVNGIAAKELCMVGVTRHDPSHYYYRIATFKYSEGNAQYQPTNWGQWQKFNIQIHPVKYTEKKIEKTGAAIPVFAFGKWYVFWVEQKQSGGTPQGENQSPKKNYTATIHYSNLDFSKRWVAAQTLASIPLSETSINSGENSATYPVYFYSTQTLYIPFEEKLYQLTEDNLSRDVVVAYRFQSASPPPQNKALSHGYSDPQFQYYPKTGKDTAENAMSISTWFKVSTDEKNTLCENGITVEIKAGPEGGIFVDNELLLDSTIKKDEWNYFAAISNNFYLNGKALDYQNPGNDKDKVSVNSISSEFTGSLQETVYFNTSLSAQQVEALYDQSKDCITRDFESNLPYIKNDVESKLRQPVLAQPNWNIVGNGNTEYLDIPYINNKDTLLNIYRLNTTAIYQLGSLLNQPEGIDALLSVAAQESPELPIKILSQGNPYLPENYPSDKIDFTRKSAMANYYWEVFFHLPFLIANELHTHQHFKQAKSWLDYIFNPSVSQKDLDLKPGETPNDKFWRFVGLRSAYNFRLEKELSESSSQELRRDLENPTQLYETDTDPFDPWAIADFRPIVYQKTIVMHYIDNLLTWGDMLYRKNTRTSIVEAELFYVMAYDLLGEHPNNLGANPFPTPENYKQVSQIGWKKILETNRKEITCILDAGYAIYAGTEKGLWSNDNPDGKWEQVTEVNPSENDGTLKSAHIICLLNVENVIYAGANNGLWSNDNPDGKWAQVTEVNSSENNDTLKNTRINCLLNAGNAIYAGTEKGLWSNDNPDGKWAQVTEVNPSEKDGTQKSAHIICLLNAGNVIYAGTSEGRLWSIHKFFFDIPRNRQFFAYWDKIQQRLYNIRHGLTIDGKKDMLPLFQPPINPMQLVSAVASGESVDQAIQSLNTVIPYYRFSVMIEKAKSVTQTVISLGQSLLSALEKKDAEQLAILYNTNQKHLLELTRDSKEDALSAAEQNVQALRDSLTGAQNRLAHYTQLISSGLSASETEQLNLAKAALAAQSISEPIKIASAVLYGIPNIYGLADGGSNYGNAMYMGADVAQSIGNDLNAGSSLAGTVASYQRRTQDWQLQETLAQDDINQIQCQIVAAQYQQDLAQQEIDLLEKNIEQEKKVAEFYLNKFTNSQLYQWYIGQVSALYFQAYQLAHDIAIQAENAWKFEHIGRKDTSDTTDFIKPGYWNSLRQGLLAGEALQLDLQRMEKAFTDQDERRLEIEKTISLAQLDPLALMDLKTKGSCVFDIMEKDFDFDFPGHFCRKIKTVSVSLPVLLGPYQNIHATLTQLSNKIITSDDSEGQTAVNYLLGVPGASPTGALKVDVKPNQQVALTQGVNDSGLFELNFNDARYLPFEGTGGVSSWMLEMPLEENAIDFESLADVIIQMRYTALPGSAEFKSKVKKARGSFNGYRVFSLGQEFAPAWQEFINSQNPQPLKFNVHPSRWRRNMSSFKINGLSIYLDGADRLSDSLTLEIHEADNPFVFSAWTHGMATHAFPKNNPLPIDSDKQSWILKYENSGKEAAPSTIKNIFLIVDYSVGS